jgi:two-component system chemotaxis response regulator CheB
METRNIIVIGASAGGFETIKRLVAGLPADLQAAIFIVWHVPPDVKGILPQVLNRLQTVKATQAADREPIEPGRIYVPPPDRHLILEKEHVRVTHGPKENGFRPAVDPLFRSAAYYHGPRVIGIILSGSLDDGTAGLWTIKQYGGLAIVQDPAEAEVPSMPASAIREVAVDHIITVADMAPLLVKLTSQEIPFFNYNDMENNNKTGKEVRIAIQDETLEEGVMQFGELTPYTCPECHGVLSAIKEGQRIRYRCHTGHAFSADSLLAIITENIEHSMWDCIRAMEESILLLNHMGDHFAEVNQPSLAAQYFKKANECMERSKLIRKAVLSHEQLSTFSFLSP